MLKLKWVIDKSSSVRMASILQNVFARALYTIKDNEGVKKIKSLASHASLYMGIVIYTAIGAKVIIYTVLGALR